MSCSLPPSKKNNERMMLGETRHNGMMKSAGCRHIAGLVAITCLITLNVPIDTVRAFEQSERDDLYQLFTDQGVEGAFVLLDSSRSHLILVNAKRAGERRFPASTFKIFNSLIALEMGAVQDENEIIPYGGRPQPIKRWERDMSMRDAIRISNVPIYQELARRIGKEQYRKWLTKLNYGNGRIGNNVEAFWLRGPLAISPIEQVQLLARLARRDLPASKRSQSIVADIMSLESKAGARLYGKTGWSTAAAPGIGWFVGWVERGSHIFAFALTLDIVHSADAKKRLPLTRDLLKALGVY